MKYLTVNFVFLIKFDIIYKMLLFNFIQLCISKEKNIWIEYMKV